MAAFLPHTYSGQSAEASAMPPERESAPLPPGRLRRAYDSLSVRLFIWLFGIMVVIFTAYAIINIRTTEKHSMQLVYQGANRAGEIIKRSTRHAMLLNRKEDVDQIITTIADLPGVAGVRIYDKQGTIIVSAQPGEVGRKVDMKAEACIICHDQAKPLQSVPTESRMRVYRDANGERVLGLINPIENEPQCTSCHVHRPDQTVLGVLDVKMSLAGTDERLAATKRWMIAATLLTALLLGAFSALFINRVVRVPVKRLIAGTQRIARGDLETRVPIETRDEVGELAAAFNHMTEDLRRAREEIQEWSQTLEQKVVEKTEELGRAQRQIIHMEKMASLGKLAATVAHELNNPLAGILTYAKLVEREIGRGEVGREVAPEERDELRRYLAFIQKESSRCGDIVKNLLLFARRSGAQLALQHLNPILEQSLMLVNHHIAMAGIRLETRPLAGDDELVCDADQLKQALVALLVNAVEAMPEGGTLAVRAEGEPGGVRIAVADTGVGIPPDVLPHIYEPFFTTKEGGSGVGLGLAVAYGIVEQHGGRIEVASELGRGTTFEVHLPRRPAGAQTRELAPAVGAGASRSEPR
jgi:two-component system NtrC family sensor kinase